MNVQTVQKTAERSVPAKVADELRSLIARGALAPGTRLGQTELAAQFDASRVPVREALKLLSSEGIIEHDPNRGFFVARLSRDEAEQLFTLRHLVEEELMRTIEWPEEALMAELEQRAVRMEELLNAGDRSNWWTEHCAFHTAFFNLSPKKTIVREAMRLWVLTDRFCALLPLPRRPSEERNVVSKHTLIAALRERDREKLVAVGRSRREAFEAILLETLDSRGL